MPVKHPRFITLQLSNLGFDPADSTTYYFSAYPSSPTTSITANALTFPYKGKVVGVNYCTFSANATGTNEDISLSLRISDTTDYLVQTVGLANAVRTFKNMNLNIPVTATDTLAMKLVCPAWVTNPQAMRGNGQIIMLVP